ncbi:adenylyltransferase/cytidyltransferase family protein, partial [Proteus mirabilis]
GKFYPLHTGHIYLIQRACEFFFPFVFHYIFFHYYH